MSEAQLVRLHSAANSKDLGDLSVIQGSSLCEPRTRNIRIPWEHEKRRCLASPQNYQTRHLGAKGQQSVINKPSR